MLLLSAALLAAAEIVSAAAPAARELVASGPSGPLKGTLMPVADRKAPVVLIIPGSGPTDRDGNNPLGVKAAPYRLLAEGLAAQGVASVRIDKRGLFGSAAAIPDPNAVTMDDYARDVQAWVDVIRADRDTRCVWVLGHSEGGLVALAAAAHYPEQICGLVLVATPGRPLADVIKTQLQLNPANAPLLDTANKLIDTLSAGKRVSADQVPAPLAPLFRPQIQGFLISAFALDPAKLVAHFGKPVLILQGARDIQVSVDDAQRLKRADPAATLTVLPDTNHVLKRVTSDDRGANLAAYADPNLPLAPGVVEAVAGFVKSVPR